MKVSKFKTPFVAIILMLILDDIVTEEDTGSPTETEEQLLPVTESSKSEETFFSFPEFDYAESSKNEVAFKEWEAACSQTPACLGRQPLQKLRCIRKCVSPSCYNEVYAFDELEEGEIDIRFQSFKGCFVQRLHKRRL